MQASVKNLMLIIVLVNCLSGCAGYYRSRSAGPVEKELSRAILVVPVEERALWKRTEPKYLIDERALSPGYQEQLKNPAGKEIKIYANKTQWCGLTVWAIIPIPLWRPACKSYTELTFENGVPVSAREQYLEGYGYICGPLVPLLDISDAPLSERFCEEIRHIQPATDDSKRRGRSTLSR